MESICEESCRTSALQGGTQTDTAVLRHSCSSPPLLVRGEGIRQYNRQGHLRFVPVKLNMYPMCFLHPEAAAVFALPA